MAQRSGRPRRDMRQLNLNFFVNVSDEGPEPSSPTPMDDREVRNAAADAVNTVVPNVRVGLQQSQIITQKFNQKWKVGRSWLYYSKPPGGPLAGIMKCSACEEFRTGSAGSRIWGAIGCTTIQISAMKMHEKSDDHKFAFTR